MDRMSIAQRAHTHWLFLLTVVVPTALAVLYFGLIASDVYISESRFVVRSPERQQANGLGFLLRSSGFGNAGEEIYAVQDYALSRDALKALNQGDIVAKAYSADHVDLVNRYGAWSSSPSFEKLFKYYQSMVQAEHDSNSTITTLTVRAFTAQEAHLFNERLLRLSEGLVNRLNTRGQTDLIEYAEKEMREAQLRERSTAAALSRFRNQQGIVDPEAQAKVEIELLAQLQNDLIATRNQLAQLRASAPENPQVEVLLARERSLQKEISQQSSGVAGSRRSLAGKASRYQQLQLESQFASRQLASAMASLEEARNEARRQQVYLERIVQPSRPDDAMEPRRLRGILATFLLGLIIWGITSMLLAGVREHQD